MPISHVVIVGAGLAGARSVMELRSRGYTGKITLLGAEHQQPYDRPPLSEELLSRCEPKWLRDEVGADLASVEVDVSLGEEVQGIARRGDSWVLTTHRRRLEADAVIAATGAHARMPSAWRGAVTLHTWEDSQALKARVTQAESLVCIGAGWIGAEVGSVAASAGLDVSVIEAGPAPLFSVLGEEVGALLIPWYEKAGITLRTNATVATANAQSVTLTNGEMIVGDTVLAAVGIGPQTQWVESTAVRRAVSGHIWVDSAQRTSLPNLWAVGDCTIRESQNHGVVVGGHWDAALNDPARAAASLLSQEIPSEPAPYIFSSQLGHNIALIGTPHRGTRWELRQETPIGRDAGDGQEAEKAGDVEGTENTAANWSALWFDEDDALTAVFTVDRPRDTIDARRLLAAGPIEVSEEVALDASQRLRAARI